MLEKEAATQLRTEFWTSWVAVMEKRRSVSGRRINWATYPLHVSHCYVRMLADAEGAHWYLDIQHRDAAVRLLIYEQFEEFKGLMENEMGQLDWIPERIHPETGLQISTLSKSMKCTSILRKRDWMQMHEFLENTIVGFDRIWSDMGDIIRDLSK